MIDKTDNHCKVIIKSYNLKLRNLKAHGYVCSMAVGTIGEWLKLVPDIGCLGLHIRKGEDHFYTLNAHFIFAKFWTVLHLS